VAGKQTPADPEDGFTQRAEGTDLLPAVRFLGTASINGQGRNTFARSVLRGAAAGRALHGDDYDAGEAAVQQPGTASRHQRP